MTRSAPAEWLTTQEEADRRPGAFLLWGTQPSTFWKYLKLLEAKKRPWKKCLWNGDKIHWEQASATLNVFHEQEGTGSATAGDWVLVNKVWSGAGAILKSVWMCKINIWHPDTAQGEYCTRLEEGIATVQSNSGNYFSFMIVKLCHLWPLSPPPHVISKTVAFVTLNAILYFPSVIHFLSGWRILKVSLLHFGFGCSMFRI